MLDISVGCSVEETRRAKTIENQRKSKEIGENARCGIFNDKSKSLLDLPFRPKLQASGLHLLNVRKFTDLFTTVE